jgi:Flp pilus assembly protein TadG
VSGAGCSTLRRTKQRGNAMVEFALGLPLLVLLLTGAYRFGYTFYAYNLLQSATREGARYGSLADYDGATSGTDFRARVQNMVVYANPSPTGNPPAVVPGLTTGNVTVNPQLDAQGVPTKISVQIDNFASSLFVVTLNAKPKSTFDYVGRYTN